jgi:hypothetical protein
MSLDNDLRNLLHAEADRFEVPTRISPRLLRRARVQRLESRRGRFSVRPRSWWPP